MLVFHGSLSILIGFKGFRLVCHSFNSVSVLRLVFMGAGTEDGS